MQLGRKAMASSSCQDILAEMLANVTLIVTRHDLSHRFSHGIFPLISQVPPRVE
jgi:hypothetical protein